MCHRPQACKPAGLQRVRTEIGEYLKGKSVLVCKTTLNQFCSCEYWFIEATDGGHPKKRGDREVAPRCGRKERGRGAESTRTLLFGGKPARMLSPRVGRIYASRSFAAAPSQTDADVPDVIAVAGVVIDRSYFVEKELVPIADIHKCSFVDEQFHPGLGPDRTSRVAVIPRHTDKSSEIRNDDIGHTEVIVQERCGRRSPNIPPIIDKLVVQCLPDPELPTGS